MCADIGQIAFVIFTMLMNFFVLYCINIATQFVSGDDAFEKHDKSILKSVGGPTLVIIIVCCVLLFILLVILVKRQLLRIRLLSKSGSHTPTGAGAPKSLSNSIDANIQRVKRMRIEPRMLAENVQHLCCENSPLQSSSGADSVHYMNKLIHRYKAIDAVTCLDDMLCSVDVEFCRKSHQTVQEHLMSLLKPPRAPLAGCKDLCEKIIKLYEHARYGKIEFGEYECNEIITCIDELKTRLREKLNIPGTLVSADIGHSGKDDRRSAKGVTQRTRTKPTAVFYTSLGQSRSETAVI
ncbi:protein C1orf43 homolog isoform X2 [Xenia sp. Carnegie-2017]|uniref:protein C1orf43 homolog isoform X2 n=1 Tax=Xenia sp. Carnegie-2017 TaxID=2897299 RepID=UPI001F0451D3|nr:protein C1orf43 homolog isoform X2 [Xenia sp. Carnegie-2017]